MALIVEFNKYGKKTRTVPDLSISDRFVWPVLFITLRIHLRQNGTTTFFKYFIGSIRRHVSSGITKTKLSNER